MTRANAPPRAGPSPRLSRPAGRGGAPTKGRHACLLDPTGTPSPETLTQVHASFTFLGFAFRPREARNKNGTHFTSFLPAISPETLKAKGAVLRAMRIHRRTNLSLDDLARWPNPIVAGWMNYYGRYYRSALHPLLRRVSTYLRRWAGKKYRRLRTHKRFKRWWTGLLDREPGLFAHWEWVRAY